MSEPHTRCVAIMMTSRWTGLCHLVLLLCFGRGGGLAVQSSSPRLWISGRTAVARRCSSALSRKVTLLRCPEGGRPSQGKHSLTPHCCRLSSVLQGVVAGRRSGTVVACDLPQEDQDADLVSAWLGKFCSLALHPVPEPSRRRSSHTRL